ncbi:DUF4007 family protein [Brevibacillus brevis]|uniref:DUF4007 family protein n=1 Tax=Brevibacillus brevis TaxID=1393 RepID=UPI001C8E63D3|nr:DUF4007 family protein [Brevibacillus brevis]MBY0086980.1 DUF4007 family protein [Brevibacillus brevis]
MKFGQHQTFHLRVNWLRKGISMLRNDPRFFYDNEAAEKVGLGKNMVQSLKFWMTVTNIINEIKDLDSKQTLHIITGFGNIVDKYDPYLNYPDTLSILHFNLLDRTEPITVWDWFFNINNNKLCTKEELVNALISWASTLENVEPLEKSIKRDMDCLLRLYTTDQAADPEDVTQSPLSALGLISEHKSLIKKNVIGYKTIGLSALMYSLLKYGEKNEVNNLSVDEIENSSNLWGKIFHLSRIEIIKALEALEAHPLYPITFIRTNSLNDIILPEVSSEEFIHREYKAKEEQFVYD